MILYSNLKSNKLLCLIKIIDDNSISILKKLKKLISLKIFLLFFLLN